MTESVAQAAQIPSMTDWARALSGCSADVVAFQIVYRDGLVGSLDPAFLPVDGRGNSRQETREIGLFLRMFHTGLYRCAQFTGILSPKFNAKSRIQGAQFLEFIRQNPGYNVYFINPMPQNIYYSFNVWHHGELCHRGLMGLAEILFDRAGFDASLIVGPRDTNATALFCSYWIGDEKFWNGYVPMIIRLMETLQDLPASLRERFFVLDPKYPDPNSMAPFIFERTFSALLHSCPDVKALAYPHARRDTLPYCNVFEREIVIAFGNVVDEIDQRQQYNSSDREVFNALARLHLSEAEHKWLPS
jgi:hypothetical protein